MFESLLQFILNKAEVIQQQHAVNPWIYLSLVVVCTGPYYFSLFKFLKSVVKKEVNSGIIWLVICLTMIVLPNIYILIWGKNLPWYIYAAIAGLTIFGIFALIQKVRASRKNASNEKKSDNSAKTDNSHQPPVS